MARRLMGSYILLLTIVLISLEVPFGITLADEKTQKVVSDRLADAIRFASLTEPGLRVEDVSDLRAELNRYYDLYLIKTIILDVDDKTVFAVPQGTFRETPEVRRQSTKALAGQQAVDSGTIWPWRSEPLVVAVPIGNSGQSLGAFVIVSPVQSTARTIGMWWVVLTLGGLIVLVGGTAAARYVALWTLRPIARLDSAVHRIGAGNYQVRIPDHSGPPELRRLTNAFNEMTAMTSELLERQKSFVTHASHQLRNPLAALRLHVEELSDELISDSAQESHRLALEETERLCQVLDSFLALARVDIDQYIIERVDIEECVAARVAVWNPLASMKGITLQYIPSPEKVEAYAASTAIDQILDAVIDNAVKFCTYGCEVVVYVTVGAENVEIHVADNGPGLSASQRERACERFWRGPGSETISGSGLGLAIVMVLVDVSGGYCELLDNEPHGLHVRIGLAIARE